MEDMYNDYPEQYSNNVISALNNEYSKKEIKPNSFLQQILKEQSMQKAKLMQTEENDVPPTTSLPTDNVSPPIDEATLRENFRLYSYISNQYCNLISLFNTLISMLFVI